MDNKTTSEPAHDPACCADVFGKEPPVESAADAPKAFANLLRAVQSAGSLNEKTKELILFALVVHSRCGPCFDAHFEKARALGITRAELDEAAWCAIAMGGAPVRMFYQERLHRLEAARG